MITFFLTRTLFELIFFLNLFLYRLTYYYRWSARIEAVERRERLKKREEELKQQKELEKQKLEESKRRMEEERIKLEEWSKEQIRIQNEREEARKQR